MGLLIEQEATEITESLCRSLFPLFEASNMHTSFSKASGLTHDVIGSAIEVHKDKGPGHEAAGHSPGLIVNFNESKLTDGVSRLILPGANLE